MIKSYPTFLSIQKNGGSLGMLYKEKPIVDSLKYPRIAWLLSFPNSGTSFTITQVTKITNATTATNYIKEIKSGPNSKKPVNPDISLKGPFACTNNLPLPNGYVLTKTHCTGKSTRRIEVISISEFMKECAHVKYDDGEHEESIY